MEPRSGTGGARDSAHPITTGKPVFGCREPAAAAAGGFHSRSHPAIQSLQPPARKARGRDAGTDDKPSEPRWPQMALISPAGEGVGAVETWTASRSHQRVSRGSAGGTGARKWRGEVLFCRNEPVSPTRGTPGAECVLCFPVREKLHLQMRWRSWLFVLAFVPCLLFPRVRSCRLKIRRVRNKQGL